jgi:hypothetical protein
MNAAKIYKNIAEQIFRCKVALHGCVIVVLQGCVIVAQLLR